ncbi:DNA polymerase I, partial [hydrothermal vent metagenome]
PAKNAEEVAKIVREEMESAMDLSVPLVVDLSIANNWFEAK